LAEAEDSNLTAVGADGKSNELEVARGLRLKASTILVLQREYNDYAWFEQLTRVWAPFITTMKTTTVYTTAQLWWLRKSKRAQRPHHLSARPLQGL
jgi:hypothetical protein